MKESLSVFDRWHLWSSFFENRYKIVRGMLLVMAIIFTVGNEVYAGEESEEYSISLSEKQGKSVSLDELWYLYQENNVQLKEWEAEQDVYKQQFLFYQDFDKKYEERLEQLENEPLEEATKNEILKDIQIKQLENQYQMNLVNAYIQTKDKSEIENRKKLRQEFIKEITELLKLEADQKQKDANAVFYRINRKIKETYYQKEQIRYVDYQKANRESEYANAEQDYVDVLIANTRAEMLRETGAVSEIRIRIDFREFQPENIKRRIQRETATTSWKEDFNNQLILSKREAIDKYREKGLPFSAEREALFEAEIAKLEAENRRYAWIREKSRNYLEKLYLAAFEKYQKAFEYSVAYHNFMTEKYRLQKEALVSEIQIKEWEKEAAAAYYVHIASFAELLF